VQLHARDFYVHPQGSDTALGSITSPLRTVIRAIKLAQPGDTVILREGIYRQEKQIGENFFSHSATANARITLKGYLGETAIITSMKLRSNINDWTEVPGYPQVYATPIAPSEIPTTLIERIPNCSQNGRPLKLMTSFKENGSPSDLTGPGQWVRNINDMKFFVWSIDGQNPGNQHTEISEFVFGGSNTIDLRHNPDNDNDEADYITFDNLVIEGGYYPIAIGVDHIQIKNCTIRNCYGDGVKGWGFISGFPDNPGSDTDYYNADYGLVENCDIYYFGENAIDVTGGDYWTLRRNRIHDGVDTRGDRPSGRKTAGIMLKNNNRGAVVDGNVIYDLVSEFSVISVGATTEQGYIDEAVNALIKNNVIYNVLAPQAVQFASTRDCGFYNNSIHNSSFYNTIIMIRLGRAGKLATNNMNLRVFNNIFFNNNVEYKDTNHHWTFWEYQSSDMRTVENLQFDYNLVDANMTYYYQGDTRSLSQIRQFGFEVHSATTPPAFRDLATHDYYPIADSPQVDTGKPYSPTDLGEYDPYLAGETDGQGGPRVIDGDRDSISVVDIGPFEYSNTEPSLGDMNLSTDEDTELDILLNATDPDNDTLTSIVVTDPIHGSLSGSGLTLQYQPEPNYFGSDSFQLKVNDGALDSDVAMVSITIHSQNDAPIFASQPTRVVNTLLPFSFTVSAIDPENDSVIYSAQNLPNGAVFTGQSFDWIPSRDDIGQYIVNFTASDGQAQSLLSVMINVIESNHPPQISPMADKQVQFFETLTLSVSASDPDLHSVTISAGSIPEGASFNGQQLKKLPGRSWDSIKLRAQKLNIKRSYDLTRTTNIEKLLLEIPEAYYWMGFLLADGHFTNKKVILGLGIKDINHIKKFANFISANYTKNKIKCFVRAANIDIVPLIKNKFKITNRKTYDPPSLQCENKELLLSLIIGFIDGDGSIRKQSGRNDAFITIKCHASWLSSLQFMSNTICDYCDLKPNIAKINKQGYAVVNFSNSILLKFLKKEAKRMKLPILKRKWDRINEKYIGKIESYQEVLEKVKILIEEGLKNYDIAPIVNRSPAAIYQMVNKHNLR
tara:strand:- start:2608 stop:5805 length:3198 start_codon:yes stop_codon:yes gene_type:complete